MNKHLIKIQKQVIIAGAIGGSLLVSLPTLAMPGMMKTQKLSQSTSPLNPSPSIFNEPPYSNRSSDSNTDGMSGMMPASTSTDNNSMMQMPGNNMSPGSKAPSSSTRPSGPSSTSPQNPNLPAEAPSPYLQQQQNGDAAQPTSSTGMKKNGNRRTSSPSSTSPQNPNLPAEAPSPYLQQQQNGDAAQPNTPTGSKNRSNTDTNSQQNPNQPATIPAPDTQQNGGNPR